jgi:hypothetical protein
MFSCLGRLGCLLVLLVAGALGWFTRDLWVPKLRARFAAAPPPVVEARWEPLTAEGAARARAALERLAEKSGPVYVNVAAGDFAAFLLDSALRGFGAGATGAEARARDDRLSLRAEVSVADLGGPKVLGPLTSVVKGRQALTVRGRLEVLKPGRAQFRVDQIAIGELTLPAAMIPKLTGRIAAKDRDSSVSPDAIPLRVPRTLGDVRVGKGRMTLYKNLP